MPHGRKKDPANMTAEEELRNLLQWAEQMQLENVAAVLRRVLIKLSHKGSFMEHHYSVRQSPAAIMRSFRCALPQHLLRVLGPTAS
jgi:hypothetical protein